MQLQKVNTIANTEKSSSESEEEEEEEEEESEESANDIEETAQTGSDNSEQEISCHHPTNQVCLMHIIFLFNVTVVDFHEGSCMYNNCTACPVV